MKNISQNNPEFYTSIAKYYDYIFPLKNPAFAFTKSLIDKKMSILDAGCATGSLSIALSPYCHKIKGIDLDSEMIKMAQIKATNYSNTTFEEGDLLNFLVDNQENDYDLIICYGNTLVHILALEDISNFLGQVFKLLKSGGRISIQILNYNYILNENITSLPTIENEHIRFIRNYNFKANLQLIDFNTELILKETKERIKNTTELIAIKPDELKSLLIKTGYKNIEMYSSFKRETYNNKELPLIVTAEK
ncbi:MAG: hypothetical protein C0599_14135 [Salinivirgaceae bacterium]|nr:MAG: hypothetical protein C0599_14135 [Salinivirgaceae bacterium]